jgi:hypothetical protein
MKRPPLTNENDSTILARVALQVVRRRIVSLGRTSIPPSSVVSSASYLLPHDGFTMLRFALHSLAAHLSCGYTSLAWLQGVSYRSSFGGVWRWHFFAEYKDNRRSYPPVSNTGVQDSRKPFQRGKTAQVSDV